MKRLARRRGMSEAEVIRQAIDQQGQSAANQPVPPDPQALETLIQFALGRRKRGAASEACRWQREDAYEERDQHLAPPEST